MPFHLKLDKKVDPFACLADLPWYQCDTTSRPMKSTEPTSRSSKTIQQATLPTNVILGRRQRDEIDTVASRSRTPAKTARAREPSSDSEQTDNDDNDDDVNSTGSLDKDLQDLTDEELEKKENRDKLRRAEKRRWNYIINILGLDPDCDDDDEVINAMYSVGPAAFMQYASHWNRMRRNGFELTRQGFRLCLNRVKHNLGAKSIHHWQSAVNFYHVVTGQDGEKAFTAATVTGYNNRMNNKVIPPKRGGLTLKYLQQLISMKGLPAEYRDAFILLHATGVRGNQLLRLRTSHFYQSNDGLNDQKKGEKVYNVLVRANFKGRCSTDRSDVELHQTLPEWHQEVTRILKQAERRAHSKNPFPRLAETWSATRANQYVKKAAKLFKWNTKLIWVVHGIRHGAAIDAFHLHDKTSLLDKIRRLHLTTGHASLKMMLHYCRENAARVLQTSLDEARGRHISERSGGRISSRVATNFPWANINAEERQAAKEQVKRDSSSDAKNAKKAIKERKIEW